MWDVGVHRGGALAHLEHRSCKLARKNIDARTVRTTTDPRNTTTIFTSKIQTWNPFLIQSTSEEDTRVVSGLWEALVDLREVRRHVCDLYPEMAAGGAQALQTVHPQSTYINRLSPRVHVDVQGGLHLETQEHGVVSWKLAGREDNWLLADPGRHVPTML